MLNMIYLMKKSSIICVVIGMVLISAICATTEKTEDSIFTANVEALSDGETPPKVPCIAAEKICSTIIMAADSVCYSMEIENMQHI